MDPGWAKKFEIFDGSGMGKKSCIFLWSCVGKLYAFTTCRNETSEYYKFCDALSSCDEIIPLSQMLALYYI
jgi:hypothetical protein